MPPLLRIDRESLSLHRSPQQGSMATLLFRSSRVVGISPLRHLVIQAGHNHWLPGPQVKERQIDGASPIVTRSLFRVRNEDSLVLRGSIPEHPGHIPGAIGIMDEQAVAFFL